MEDAKGMCESSFVMDKKASQDRRRPVVRVPSIAAFGVLVGLGSRE